MAGARAAILVYFALFATAFALLVPPFEAPDEPGHLAYVTFLAVRAELPNQYDPQRALLGHGPSPPEGHQPPLYYASAALLLRLVAGQSNASGQSSVSATPAPNPVHAWNGGSRADVPLFQHAGSESLPRPGEGAAFVLLRLFSVALGVLNVAAVLALTRHFFTGRWQLLPAIFVATLPQFLFVSGAINNDGLANLLTTLCFLAAVRLLEAPEQRRHYLALGGSLGLALLAKKTSLFVLPGLALLVAYVAYRRWHEHSHEPGHGHESGHGHEYQRWLAQVAASTVMMLGLTVLLSGWWFVRNQVLYGDALGTQMEKATLTALVREKSLRSPYFLGQFRREFFQSFVATFGWMQVLLPGTVYRLYALLFGASAAGLVLAVRSGRIPVVKAAFAGIFVLGCFAGIIVYNLTYSQPQGRFLFPVLALLVILLTAGLRELLRYVPSRRAAAALVSCLVAGFVLTDVLSVATIVQFYGRPGLFR